MRVESGRLERIRQLTPLSRLPVESVEALLAHAGHLVELEVGDAVHLQDAEDPCISYLLSGRVERSVNGRVLDVLDTDREPRNRPLDDHAHKRDTVRALSRVTLLRIELAALERACARASDDLDGSALEVLDIAADTSTDWHTRLLRSPAFLRLSAAAIQRIFDRMEEVEVADGEAVVRQGEPGDHYYVVQSGRCEVVRRPTGEGREVHLADVGPGEAFGEEALITGAARNATVRMIGDGSVMRLPKADFLDLLVTPLVRGVTVSQGRWLVGQGGNWVDVRDAHAGNGHTLAKALHLPMHLLRLQSRRLDPAHSHVVYAEDVNSARLAAFLLAERGFEAAYLEEPVSRVNLETKPMNDTENRVGAAAAAPQRNERLPRDQFAETTTGEELADLIDELVRERDALGEQGAPAHGKTADGPAAGDTGEAPAPARRDAEVIGLNPREVAGELLRDVEREVGQSINRILEQQRRVLETRLTERLARIEQVARDRMEAHERQVEAHYAERLRQKERELAAAYDRLTSLANRFSHQKADIQKSRKALAEMLRTASRVHQEVYRMGNVLVDQVGHIDDLQQTESRSAAGM